MRTRTFLTTLALFLLFFNGAILLVTVTSLRDSMRAAKESCLSEHYVVAAALLKDMQTLESRGIPVEPALPELMRSYSQFSRSEGGFYLYQDGKCIYSGFSAIPPELDWESLADGNRVLSAGREAPVHLTVSGRFPASFAEYALVYQYRVQEVLDSWTRMKNTLYLSGMAFSAVLAVCLLLLLNRIFRPLGQIHRASQSIAAGEYENRLPVTGRDELAGVAKSFNEMAEEIQKKMAELNRAAEQKQRFIDNFAHELRTPLTAIYGYAEYLQRAAVTEEEKVTAAGYILSECRRMQGMASQLLELAMLRAGEAEGRELSVTELFRGMETALSAKAAARAVRISCRQEIPSLYGNRELLECLLINLADNAVKACAEGGEVLVCADRSPGDGSLRLSVRDNGRGMTEEELAHATEAFYRADKARSRAAGGAGLGLSICEQIAAAHGARLRFSSEAGKGTTAFVIFTTP